MPEPPVGLLRKEGSNDELTRIAIAAGPGKLDVWMVQLIQ